MKELYTSPELKVTCFAPMERLASNNSITFDDLLDLTTGGSNFKPNNNSDSDFKVDLP